MARLTPGAQHEAQLTALIAELETKSRHLHTEWERTNSLRLDLFFRIRTIHARISDLCFSQEHTHVDNAER
jgi:hypothetical protein